MDSFANIVIPWLRYGLVALVALECVLIFLVLWIWKKGESRPDVGWIAGMMASYAVIGLFTLDFLDMTSLEDFRWNNRFRLLTTQLGLLFILGYFESFNSDWNTRLFKILAVLISLPVGHLLLGLPLERGVELSRLILPWHESITVAQQTYHPLASFRNGVVLLMFLSAWGRSLWQIAHGRDVQRHAFLAVATSLSLLLTGAIVFFAERPTIPLSAFGGIGITLVMVLPLIDEMVASRRLGIEIAQKEKQMRFMASQVPGVLYSLQLDSDGSRRFLFLSERVSEVLGFAANHPDPLLAFAQGLSPNDLERYHQSEEEAIRTLRPWSFSAPYRRADGTQIWFQGFAHLSRNAKGFQSNGVLLDITEQVERDREVRQLLKEVTLRNNELEGLIYTLSHDLRTPLVNIEGFSSETALLLAAAEHWNEDIRSECLDNLRLLRAESQRMSRLIASLLLLGRRSRDTLNIATLNTEMVVRSVVDNLPFISQGVRVELSSPMPACRGDASQLRLVLSKVLENCIDYRKPNEEGWVHIEAVRDDDRVLIVVRDSGLGFLSQYADKVFQAFHQLNPNEKHEGIGLTIARIALIRMDGAIQINSVPGEGTTVRLSLPAA